MALPNIRIDREPTYKTTELRYIEFDDRPEINWSPATKSVVIHSQRVRDFYEKSYHDYRLYIPLDHFRRIMEAVPAELLKKEDE